MTSVRVLALLVAVMIYLVGLSSATPPATPNHSAYQFGTLTLGQHGCSDNGYQGASFGCAEFDTTHPVNGNTGRRNPLCCDLGTNNCAIGTPILSSNPADNGACSPSTCPLNTETNGAFYTCNTPTDPKV